MLAPTDGTASGHDGCKRPNGIPINESALRDVEATAIGQQVLAFKAATGRGIDEASDRRLAARRAVPASFDPNLPPTAHLSSPATSLFRGVCDSSASSENRQWIERRSCSFFDAQRRS